MFKKQHFKLTYFNNCLKLLTYTHRYIVHFLPKTAQLILALQIIVAMITIYLSRIFNISKLVIDTFHQKASSNDQPKINHNIYLKKVWQRSQNCWQNSSASTIYFPPTRKVVQTLYIHLTNEIFLLLFTCNVCISKFPRH